MLSPMASSHLRCPPSTIGSIAARPRHFQSAANRPMTRARRAPADAPVPALHGEGNFLDLFFHIRSLPDTESLKDAICDILADRPPRDLAEGGHGLLHVRENGVRRDAEAEAGFRPFDGAGGAVERAELARVGQEGAVTGVFAEEPALEATAGRASSPAPVRAETVRTVSNGSSSGETAAAV